MKKFLVLIITFAIFMACDYASDAISTDPDVEVTFINPVAFYVYKAETLGGTAEILEVAFVPENSIDCYLSKIIWQYIDTGGNNFFTGEVAAYLKIEGLSDTASCCDTFYLYGIQLPTEPVAEHLDYNETAEARLRFVFIDEYYGGVRTDTAEAWVGFYLWPDTIDAPETRLLLEH